MWYSHERTWKERPPDRRPDAMFPACDPDGWPDMARYLLARDLSPSIAIANRWYPSRCAGDSLARIVMPAKRTDGKVFWQARAITEAAKTRYQSPHTGRGDAVIVVAPYDPKCRPTQAVMVEGPMDALAAAGLGFLGLAVMGNTPPASVLAHVDCLVQAMSVLHVVADADSLHLWSYKCAYFNHHGTRAQLVYPYPYKDLADMPHEVRVRRFLHGMR